MILYAFRSSNYERVHKQLETCALVTKTTVQCIEILQSEVNSAHDEQRIKSAYKSLVEIYMTCTNIERTWLPLFRLAFESVVGDSSIRDHCRIYVKYLKILRNLKEYKMLLKSAVQMLDVYPKEYIPLDLVCFVYVKNYSQNDFDFNVSKVVRMNGIHFKCMKMKNIMNFVDDRSSSN